LPSKGAFFFSIFSKGGKFQIINHCYSRSVILADFFEQPMASSSSFDGKIMEVDNFQNYGGKDQCIYM